MNVFLPEGSKVKRFINFPKELDPDEDELTRSRKIRRDFLENKYARFVSAIYNGETEFKAEVPVKYQDGRTGVVNATVYVNGLRFRRRQEPIDQVIIFQMINGALIGLL